MELASAIVALNAIACAQAFTEAICPSSLTRRDGFVGDEIALVAESTKMKAIDVAQDERRAFFVKVFQRVDKASNTPTEDVNLSRPGKDMEALPFPLGLIVGMDQAKLALILAAINPKVGGVVISGRRGTGKSVLARAIHRLLPTYIERIKGNPYNIDCHGDGGIDSFLLRDLVSEGVTLKDLETELVRTPFVQVPLNVMEDSLIGTVDLNRSMKTGRTEFSPGLLAKAHRGVLYVDEVNLLDEEAANILLNVIADGFVSVEREGMSLQYPCRPMLVATYNPEEGELREHLLDRIGILCREDAPLSLEQRLEAVENVLGFSGRKRLNHIEKEESDLQTDIAVARTILPDVEITSDQVGYLCEESTRSGCEGQRAEIFATEVAKASAALAGRTKVNARDLQNAVLLSIVPRGHYEIEAAVDEAEQTMAPSSLEPLPPEPDQSTVEDFKEEEEEDTHQQPEETENDPDSQADNEEQELEIPAQFMFGVAMTPVNPGLMNFNQWTRKGKGRKGTKLFNLQRGRYVKPVFPKANKSGRLAVAATLRAAAPYQKMRRLRAQQRNQDKKNNRIVFITKDDYRIKRMAKKAGSLIIFVVDASGSMALNRMDAAKGAALTLLSEAYKSRDKICLVSFHDEAAEMLVPPTKSMALTKNRLEAMPCGGGSPLAHALTVSMRIGLNEVKVKQDVGRVVIVLLSDGRANIPMCTSMGERFDPSIDKESKNGLPSRKFLKDEVLAVCRQLSAMSDFNLLCIDTEDKFVGTGIAKDIAETSMGNYFHIVETDSATVSRITQRGLEAARMQTDGQK